MTVLDVDRSMLWRLRIAPVDQADRGLVCVWCTWNPDDTARKEEVTRELHSFIPSGRTLVFVQALSTPGVEPETWLHEMLFNAEKPDAPGGGALCAYCGAGSEKRLLAFEHRALCADCARRLTANSPHASCDFCGQPATRAALERGVAVCDACLTMAKNVAGVEAQR